MDKKKTVRNMMLLIALMVFAYGLPYIKMQDRSYNY